MGRRAGKTLSVDPARRLWGRGEKMEGFPGEQRNEQSKELRQELRLSVADRAALSRACASRGRWEVQKASLV